MAGKNDNRKIFIAKVSFSAEIDGIPYIVNKGERVREGHPLLAAAAPNFEWVGERVHFDIEDASADPGRKRGE